MEREGGRSSRQSNLLCTPQTCEWKFPKFAAILGAIHQMRRPVTLHRPCVSYTNTECPEHSISGEIDSRSSLKANEVLFRVTVTRTRQIFRFCAKDCRCGESTRRDSDENVLRASERHSYASRMKTRLGRAETNTIDTMIRAGTRSMHEQSLRRFLLRTLEHRGLSRALSLIEKMRRSDDSPNENVA